MSRSSSGSSSESSDVRPGQDERGFINRFSEIPLVKTAVSQASSIYNKAKEANMVTKISLSFAEMSIKAAVESAKFAYNVVPTPGVVGTLKEEAEKKVGQADALACKGLDFLEEKYPAIMSEPQEILSAGKDKIEKSEIIEAALIVGEAAADYINPTGTKKEMNRNEKPRVVSNRTLDRIVDVSRRTGMGLYRGGSKVDGTNGEWRLVFARPKGTAEDLRRMFFWNTAAAPWYATKTSLNLACRAAVGTADLTRDVISYLPDFSALLPRRRKVRKTDRSRIQRRTETDQSSLAVSPDKKRKRSNGDNNNSDDDTLYEMLYVKEYSSSDEDPDYCPKESDNDDESSDTVGPSDEEGDSGDSGEGDEADISEAGGQALTADQVKRSVKFDGGRIVHGPQGSLVVHVTERTPSIGTKIYLAEKEAHRANQMSGVQQKVIKDDDSALVVQQGTIHGGVVASEKAKGEKSTKSPEIKKVKSPKSQTKMPLSGTRKESVPSSPREKIAGAGSASKSGEKMKTKKSPSNKDTQVSNKEGAKNDVPTNDSNVSQKDDPSRMKGRIIV